MHSTGFQPPPRRTHFPGHIEPDAYFGPNPRRFYPALEKFPLVRGGAPTDRNTNWATRVRRALPNFRRGSKTEGALYAAQEHSWRLVSGIDSEGGLTAEADEHLNHAIRQGFFKNTSTTNSSYHEEKLRQASAHVEAKAATWARRTAQPIIDVVTNRNYVCGEGYNPMTPKTPPGCFQAVEVILRRGQTMRVWIAGTHRPVVIHGKAES